MDGISIRNGIGSTLDSCKFYGLDKAVQLADCRETTISRSHFSGNKLGIDAVDTSDLKLLANTFLGQSIDTRSQDFLERYYEAKEQVRKTEDPNKKMTVLLGTRLAEWVRNQKFTDWVRLLQTLMKD